MRITNFVIFSTVLEICFMAADIGRQISWLSSLNWTDMSALSSSFDSSFVLPWGIVMDQRGMNCSNETNYKTTDITNTHESNGTTRAAVVDRTHLRSSRSLLLLLDDEDNNKNDDEDDEEPCLHDTKQPPEWVPYNKSDDLRLWSVQQCIQRIDQSQYPEERGIHAMNRHPWNRHEKLKCRYEMTDMELLKVIEKYRNITFFGDSVMYHQVMTLFCMLDSSLYHAPEEFPAIKAHRPAYYLYEHYHTQPKLLQGSGKSNPSSRTMTSIRFVPYAPDWGPLVKKIFYEKFKRTVQDFGPQDAIVINGGAGGIHFNKHGTDDRDHLYLDDIGMEKVNDYAQTIYTQSQTASFPIYYMESFHEEWPTSNGNPSPFCTTKLQSNTNNNNNSFATSLSSCSCEMTNQDRLAGRGTVLQRHDYDNHNNMNHSSVTSSCSPHCLPASWRNDIMSSKLSLSTSMSTHHSKIRRVPIFRPLAMQQQLQSRSTHDCSHKSSATMMEMMKQLLRVMRTK